MQTKARSWLLVLLSIFLVGSVITPSFGGGKISEERKLAVVNGSVISKMELDREIKHYKKRYAEAGKNLDDKRLAELEKSTIETLINNELLYQESQKMKVQVDNASVDWQFKATKDTHQTEDAFKKWLKEMDLSEVALKNQIKRRDAINLFINKHIVQKVQVSDKEIKDYYQHHLENFERPEEIRVSHILIKVEPEAKESEKVKARQTLEKIQLALKKGEDFSALAKKLSQCPSSSKGGDLGYVLKGFMVKPFEEAAFRLKTGEISDIVETEYGYHLIKVTEKKPEHTIPFEEAKGGAEQQIRHEKAKKELAKYIAQLKEKATIKIFAPEKL